MSAEAKARAFRPDDKELDDDTHAALAFLGVNKEYEGKFPNIEMNTDRGVMRPYPHPRSEAYITGLAAYRGSQFQLNYAEAFEIVLRKY